MKIHVKRGCKTLIGYAMRPKQTTTLVLGLALSSPAFCQSVEGDYPWDKFLQTISKDMSSNIALGIGIMAVVGCGFIMAFSDLQGGAKKAVQVGLGLSIALAAGSIIGKLFSKGMII